MLSFHHDPPKKASLGNPRWHRDADGQKGHYSNGEGHLHKTSYLAIGEQEAYPGVVRRTNMGRRKRREARRAQGRGWAAMQSRSQLSQLHWKLKLKWDLRLVQNGNKGPRP